MAVIFYMLTYSRLCHVFQKVACSVSTIHYFLYRQLLASSRILWSWPKTDSYLAIYLVCELIGTIKRRTTCRTVTGRNGRTANARTWNLHVTPRTSSPLWWCSGRIWSSAKHEGCLCSTREWRKFHSSILNCLGVLIHLLCWLESYRKTEIWISNQLES